MAASKHKKPGNLPRPEPMLATIASNPFNDSDWLYEVKWDGYRVLSTVSKNDVKLYSRNGLDYTKTYALVSEDLKSSNHELVLDGEIVVLNENGIPDYDALQAYNGKQQLIYYVFDILYADGKDLKPMPLVKRKELLEQLLPAGDSIRYSDSFEDGVALYEQAKQLGLEGVVGKKKSARYEAGKRSKNWLKYPLEIRKEYVIGGWTESGSGRSFRSLLFGYYEGKKLMYLGHAGVGFREEKMPEILKRLKKYETTKSPFMNEVDAETEVHWVKPELVAEIKYATLTRSGKIRKPAIFLGFRDDKHIAETDQPVPMSDSRATTQVATSEDSNWTKIESQEIRNEDEVNMDGKILQLTNVDRMIWKGISKATLLEYYHGIASVILPHIRQRPQSMHIKWIGATQPGFYIKDMEGRGPEWIETFTVKRKHKRAGKRDAIDYLICNDEATLLYMINLGCVDINPWTSTTEHPSQPDYIVIDLDPSDDDFDKVIDTALAAKQYFAAEKLKSLVKTSGKSGMHLFLPVSGFSFRQARAMAIRICEDIHQLVPTFTTTEISVENRGSRLYIDPNQNDDADTIAAVYSARPWHLPTVSTPLGWKEVKRGLDPAAFTISTINKRLASKGDLFAGVHDQAIAAHNTSRLKKKFNIE